MAAPKGFRPPAAGKGRVAGTPNKATKALKDMILGALDQAGGQDYLVAQAAANPGVFLTLVGKVLPTTLAGDPANPITVDVRTPEERQAAAKAMLDDAFGPREKPE
jgi:hypothetical protein